MAKSGGRLVAAMRWILVGVALLGGVVIGGLWLTVDSWGPGMMVVARSPEFAPLEAPEDVRHTLDIERAGARIRAWVFDPPVRARGTALLLHGIGDDKRSLVGSARSHVRAGRRAVAVDLRGHGESSGRFLTFGVEDSLDLRALVNEMQRQELLAPPLAVVGTSYGAATAIQYAALDQRVQTVVAIAPFASLREVVPSYVRWMLGDWAAWVPRVFLKRIVGRSGAAAGFNPDAACPRCTAQSISVPVLLIHSRDDERIPFQHILAIKKALGSRAQLFPVEGATHNATGGAPGVKSAVHAWLDRQ